MAFFLLQMAHGPAWDEARGIREQDGWDEHARFMDALVDEGCATTRGRSGRCWASGRWSGGRFGWTGPAGRRPALID